MKNLYRKILLSAGIGFGILASSVSFAQPPVKQLPSPVINEDFNYKIQKVDVLGSKMAYIEEGNGETLVFLHGNPTSSYLWRNIIPFTSDTHRAIAVDLIGMGQSDQPKLDYSFQDHVKYLAAFIHEMKLENITFVAHDWGAGLAWDYAAKNPENVKRIAFMEAVVPPAFPRPTYKSMGEEFGNTFKALRDEKTGYQLVIKENMFVEKLLPSLINRPLGAKAQEIYGQPYQTEDSRKVVWEWPKELPIESKPARNVAAMEKIQTFMTHTKIPVLLAYAEPGILITPETIPWYEERIDNLETVFVGQGLHFIQEDQPVAIGRALSDWLRRN